MRTFSKEKHGREINRIRLSAKVVLREPTLKHFCGIVLNPPYRYDTVESTEFLHHILGKRISRIY